MAIQRFTVVGPRSSPEDFENYVFIQLVKHEPLKVFAVAEQDDLAKKRSPAARQEFTIRIRELHNPRPDDDSEFLYLNGEDEDRNWYRVDVLDKEVTIDLIT